MMLSNSAMARDSIVGLRAMVFVFLAMACILATVIAEQISEGKDGSVNSISEIHSLPGKPYLRVVQDSQPGVVSALEEKEDGKENMVAAPRRLKLKWSFNPFNPWQSFKVSRLADEFDHKEFRLRKKAAGCRMWSLFSGLFGRGHHHRREQGLENEEHHDHPHQPYVEREGRIMFSRPFGHGFHRREENWEAYHQQQHQHPHDDEQQHRHIGCGFHRNLFFRLFGHRHHWREHEQENVEHKDFHHSMWRKSPHSGFDGDRHLEDFENHHHHRPSFPWTGPHHELRREHLEQERRHFGRKEEGIMARAKAYFADVCDRIRGWVAPAFERKPPTIQSAAEPLGVNRVQVFPRTEAPRCQLREKLASVIVPALKEVGKSSSMADKENTSADLHQSRYIMCQSAEAYFMAPLITTSLHKMGGFLDNLTKMLGIEMQLEIEKQLCGDVGALSAHRQKFCEIFHSNPKIGVLMAFSKLHIHPVEAAMDPEGVANRVESFRNIQKVQPLSLSESDSQLLKQLSEALGLGQMVYEGVERAIQALQNNGIGENGLKDKFDTFFTKAGDREKSLCEVCLQQKIRHIRKLSVIVAEGICEGLTDSPLAAACEFVDNNDFIAKTMFAYEFKIWKLAAHMCESQMSCDFFKTKSGNNFEKEVHGDALKAGYLMEDSPKAPFINFDVNTFRHPRILEIKQQILNTEAPHHFGRRNPRNCVLHRAEMLRGNKLDFLSAEVEKAQEAMVQHGESGPVLVGESHMHPFIIRIQSMPFEFHPMESALDLPVSLNHEAWAEGKVIEAVKLKDTGIGEVVGSEESIPVTSHHEHLSGAEKLEEEAAEMEDAAPIMDENVPVKEINHAEM